MTPEEIANGTLYIELRDADLQNVKSAKELTEKMFSAIFAATRAAIEAEREACANACDAIADDKHAQYKGRPPHTPNNEHRADIYTEGESDGAGLCAAAIRARKEH